MNIFDSIIKIFDGEKPQKVLPTKTPQEILGNKLLSDRIVEIEVRESADMESALQSLRLLVTQKINHFTVEHLLEIEYRWTSRAVTPQFSIDKNMIQTVIEVAGDLKMVNSYYDYEQSVQDNIETHMETLDIFLNIISGLQK